MSQRVQTILFILLVAFLVMGIYVTMGGSTRQGTGLPRSSPRENGRRTLSGCNLGAPCTTPGEICYLDQTPNTGLLVCDLSDPADKHFVTSCVSGYYCEEDLIKGCDLRCDVASHKYE